MVALPVSILLGNGNGKFDPANPPTVRVGGKPPLFVTIGDFNGDRVQDLAVALGDNAVFIQVGNGNGTFDPANPASN